MGSPVRRLLIAATVGLLGGRPEGTQGVPSDLPEAPRVLTVSVLADNAFRSVSKWENIATGIIERGTVDLARLAGLELRVLETLPWNVPPEAGSLEVIRREVALAVGAAGANRTTGATGTKGELIVVLLGAGPPAECPARCGYSSAGGPVLLLGFNAAASAQFRFVLREQMTADFRRELAHVFGVPRSLAATLEEPIPGTRRIQNQEDALEILQATHFLSLDGSGTFRYVDRTRLRNVYRRLAERGAVDASLLVNLGVACFRAGEFDGAREMHSLALAREPGLFEAELGLAQSALALGDTAIVRSTVEAMAAKPLEADQQGLLGILLVRLGDPAGAEPFLDEAVATHPDRFTFVFNRGLARFHRERYRESAGDFEAAIALEERPEAWLNLGLSRDALGETEAAIRAFSRCLELDPEASVRREAKKFLEHLAR